MDTAPPSGASVSEQRLDETEIGVAKFVTFTEIQPPLDTVGSPTAAQLLDRMRHRTDLIDHDVFASIYNKGKLALLAAWPDRRAAERFESRALSDLGTVRHRVVRVVRDYGMFDRRESPQYYPVVTRD